MKISITTHATFVSYSFSNKRTAYLTAAISYQSSTITEQLPESFPEKAANFGARHAYLNLLGLFNTLN